MIRVALDSNILIYAELEPESEKGTRSADFKQLVIRRRVGAGLAPLP